MNIKQLVKMYVSLVSRGHKQMNKNYINCYISEMSMCVL